jgi:exopolyphosphatase/guanosine-5'-triphosphate,3'-diphosphate pyrophosphatase
MTVAGQRDDMVLADPSRQDRVAPIAVIDIGSNSIRLVIYASGGRYPFPLFNERSNCRLGEGLGADGMLQPERISVALAALSRFAGIMKSMGVATIHAVATAAVRRARNATEFTAPAEAILGQPINVLSQREEAHYVARGLTLNIPEATGFVADLGGGSLEVVALENGQVRHSTSFNFGHLSSVEPDDIDRALAGEPWLAASPGTRLYGVGGSFRALGLAYIEQTGYPLPVLHGLRIPGDEAGNLLSAFCRKDPDLSGVPLGRQKTMPTAALIMRALFRQSGAERIVVSGTSIRDGLIADLELGAVDRADFLLVVCQEISRASHRFSGVPEALVALLRPLFRPRRDAESAEEVAHDRNRFDRLLEAACFLSDMCWNEHEDVRGDLGARRVLGLPVNCVTHKERVWLATAIYHRYVGRKTNKSRPPELSVLLNRRRRAEATVIGLGLRFALTFSGGTAQNLDQIRLGNDGTTLTLHVGAGCAALVDNHATRRLQQLAQSANLEARISYD